MTVAGDIETFSMAVCPNGSCGSISESNRRKELQEKKPMLAWDRVYISVAAIGSWRAMVNV